VNGLIGVAAPVATDGVLTVHDPVATVAVYFTSRFALTGSHVKGGMKVFAPPLHDPSLDEYTLMASLRQDSPLASQAQLEHVRSSSGIGFA
jgi:hypothetical protein